MRCPPDVTSCSPCVDISFASASSISFLAFRIALALAVASANSSLLAIKLDARVSTVLLMIDVIENGSDRNVYKARIMFFQEKKVSTRFNPPSLS